MFAASWMLEKLNQEMDSTGLQGNILADSGGPVPLDHPQANNYFNYTGF